MTRRLPLLLALCFVLSACMSGGSASTPPSQPVVQLPSPTTEALPELLQTEQRLLAMPIPVSDPYSLTERLKLSAGQSLTHVVRTRPLAEHVGQEDSFWAYQQDTQIYNRVRARLVLVTGHAYWYVEDGQPFNLAALELSAETFEQQIYHTDRSVFGSEWTPGIDDDVHLTILNAVNLGQNIGGFFSAEDEYPTSVYPHSNQREMFYISLDNESPGSPDYASTLANEFQRLIDWHEDPLTPDWLDEGLSVLAQHLNNYSVDGLDQSFLHQPDTQLNNWSADPSQDSVYAGASYLFLDYFAEHYGGYSILRDLLQDPAVPPTDFDDVLAKHGYTDRFSDVLRKWLVANYIADTSIDTGEYGYSTIHFTGITPQHIVNASAFREKDQVSQYGAEYYDVRPGPGKQGPLTITLSGDPVVRLVNNDPFASTDEWWGNNYNNMDSTLTRVFDLSHLKGQPVTLQFTAWFDLEQNQDYAYVEVSTNGGKHWTTLPGTDTTNAGSGGLNPGNAYTGISGGGVTPTWTQESVDLTPYAGKKVQIRFEEVTSNIAGSQGFAVSQIRIPALNFQDNLTTDNNWASQGFLRSNNLLPQHYLVQAIVYTGTTFTVQQMNIDLASAQGTLIVPDFGEAVTRVILVVSAYALETTLQANYQLNIHVP
jgi:immune inhibitor A